MIEQRSTRTDLIRRGRETVRTSRWQGEKDVALIAPLPHMPVLSSAFVHHCLGRLAEQGYSRVVTGALSPIEQTGFLAAGFEIEEQLTLLAIDLRPGLPSVPPGLPLRRVPHRRLPEVLAVDGAAFRGFWRFDQLGLSDALRATPDSRFRMAVSPDGRVAGYAICGRSTDRGFVQRLAVHPDSQGRGTGRRLLVDGLRWMRRHGVTGAVVNTQTENRAALSLYTDTGFVKESVGLSILSASLA